MDSSINIYIYIYIFILKTTSQNIQNRWEKKKGGKKMRIYKMDKSKKKKKTKSELCECASVYVWY